MTLVSGPAGDTKQRDARPAVGRNPAALHRETIAVARFGAVRGWAQRLHARRGSLPPLILVCSLTAATSIGCSQRVHLLGFDDEQSTPTTDETTVTGSNQTSSTYVDETSPTTSGSDASSATPTESFTDAGTDGGNDAGLELPTPTNPPNILVNVLELDPDTVSTRLSALFRRLFISGNADSELIYYELEDEAYVLDVLHDDTRMDAMGYGMLLTVQFDQPELFANLWATVQSRFRYDSGPREGLYRFSCAKDFSECRDAVDSFGSFYVVTALFLAAERWQERSYHQAALDVLGAMRDKEVDGEPVDGVLNLFTEDGIPRLSPLVESARNVSPVSLMPAFFELWYVRTRDYFWHTAAENSRRRLLEIAHPETGLTPDRITESGELVEAPGMFREESYPAAFQLALDAAWFPKPEVQQSEYAPTVNRLLAFFSGQVQNNNYPALYRIDGTVVEDKTSMALVALNGAAAAVATHQSRNAFLQRAWDTTGPSGLYRFYDGVYQLLSLSFLGGELRVTFE